MWLTDKQELLGHIPKSFIFGAGEIFLTVWEDRSKWENRLKVFLTVNSLLGDKTGYAIERG